MAVPTLTSITPSTGAPASKEQVKLEGSGYNVPAIPVPVDQYPGVRVWIDGWESPTVKPVTPTECFVELPRYLGDPDALPAQVEVRIANLDANGAIIPGEDVTFPNAFTYATEEVLDPVERPFWIISLREAIEEFKRQIGLDVVFGVHPDYQDQIQLEYFEADPPVIGIRDITAADYPYHDLHGRQEVELPVGLKWEEYRDREEVELELSMILVCKNKDELFRYYTAVRRMGQRTKYLHVPQADSTPEDRALIKFRLDLAGDLGINYRQVLASMSFTATIGPVPIESPEVMNRTYEAATVDYDLRNAL